jgi:phosphoribosylformylglycinamidine synthase
VLAGHDRSDGGLVTTLLEMAFAGDCGLEIDVLTPGADPMATLFAEELGLVLEVANADVRAVERAFAHAQVPCAVLGPTARDRRIRIRCAGRVVLDDDTAALRDLWEATSFALDRLQADPTCVAAEQEGLKQRTAPPFALSYIPRETPPAVLVGSRKPRVAIVREEGSNGDREMASAFAAAGFEPWDVAMTDLLRATVTLNRFRGVAFVGGFSFADVLDSAKGWAGVIRFSRALWDQFEAFYARHDTFSLGVCNGCQLAALLGWVPWRGIADDHQPRFVQNASGRFESRFPTVRIEPSPAIMFRGMAGSVLGIWSAHGEGRAYFPDTEILDRVERERLVPLRFADDAGVATERYPFDPNGSPRGIAGLCSPDGRHLAMMPHPERTFLKWQWGWMPEAWKRGLAVSPWLTLFQNAREWCEKT